MSTVLAGAGWILGLAVALYASEKLVHYLTQLGADVNVSAGLLGLAVALGADAPEVTSALIAITRGSPDVGLGVVLGSNIYNLAGLLGISAVVAGSLATNRYRLAVDGGTNVLLTLVLIWLVAVSRLHVVLGATLLIILLAKVLIVSDTRDRILGRLPSPLGKLLHEAETGGPAVPAEPPRPLFAALGFVLLSVVFIVLGSDLLVNTSLRLGPRMGLSSGIIGTLVLAVATSVPNTWAALSLARRGFGEAAVSATFSSNSINIAFGVGIPSLALPLHASAATRTLGTPWLIGMTALAIIFCASRWSVSPREGAALMAAYAAYVVVFLVAFA